jgi:DNA end-binding protein Ku
MIELIRRKSEGEAVVIQPAAEEGPKVIDLMSALEASLAAVKKKTPAREGARQARAR